MKNVCVFCGSSEGSNPKYMELARKVGQTLAKKEKDLVYGGASIGLMGAVADEMLKADRHVLGVMPKIIQDLEVGHKNLPEYVLVEDMHERKKLMYERADCFLIIPGGYGTLDELFEALTWTQLDIHDRPVFIYNEHGFYDHLIKHFDHMLNEGFIRKEHLEYVRFVNSAEELESFL